MHKESNMDEDILGKVRLRACGVLVMHDAVLLVKHSNLGPNGYFWSPPGGEIEFGETLSAAVEREFEEECNLRVKAGSLLFCTEFIQPPLHAVELFFEAFWQDGTLRIGSDPGSQSRSIQLIDVAWWKLEAMRKEGLENYHAIFSKIEVMNDLFKLRQTL